VKNDQNLTKIRVEKVSKTVILNGKIDFFIIFTQIDTKIDQKSSKID